MHARKANSGSWFGAGDTPGASRRVTPPTLPRMQDAWLLLPDLTLIACGYLLCHYTALNRPVWEAVEKVVYHVLFPALLFSAILRHPIHLDAVWRLGASVLLLMGLGIAASYLLKPLDATGRLHPSAAQIGFRFNSYVLLALAERLAGTQGVAWTGVVMAMAVPLANLGAVWPMARHGGNGLWRELARNPLIISSLAGLVCNLLNLRLPDLASTTLGRIGGAALPLGLMAVGAGLRLGALRESWPLGLGLLGVKHLVMPAVAIALALLWPLPVQQQALLVIFAAMPTAASCYVLAVRMGGNGPYVAALITASTGLAMVGLPLALMALRAFTPG